MRETQGELNKSLSAKEWKKILLKVEAGDLYFVSRFLLVGQI